MSDNKMLAEFVSARVKERRILRRDLAKLAEVDPSYITLICRDGYIPRQSVLKRICLALVMSRVDTDLLMLMAGYMPVYINYQHLVVAVREYHKKMEKRTRDVAAPPV